jgi:competence ComEA-like helix-hairpin-helix protein
VAARPARARWILLGLLATWGAGRTIVRAPDLPVFFPGPREEVGSGPAPGGDKAADASARSGSANGPLPAAGTAGRSAGVPRGIHGEPLEFFNLGSAHDLQALSGIGPVLSARIVEHRKRHGPFRSWEDLLAVRGVGKKLSKRWKDSLEASRAGDVGP